MTKLWGVDALSETLLGLAFEVSPQSFFQVNPVQTEALYAKALDAAGIAPDCGLSLLDAYCGAGTITLAAARSARRVTGVEIVPPAIADAKRNAPAQRPDKTRFICADAARELPRLLSSGEHFDAAILDPPRKGCDAALLDALVRAKLPALSYVSCNPATLARDVKRLIQGGYRLEWAQPVDMFAWTGHVETVCLLSKIRRAPHIDIDLDMTELDVTKAETKATYEEIKTYVLEHTGLKVSHLYIAQVKAKRNETRLLHNKPEE